jgi:hypothetical protein
VKYRNVKTKVDGILFDSKMEADYYIYLKDLQANGMIAAIELQPTYLLLPSFKKLGRTIRKTEYKADFLITYVDGSKLAVDVKGMTTQAFRIKEKLFHFNHPDLELVLITKHHDKWIELKDKPKKKLKKVGKQRGERTGKLQG